MAGDLDAAQAALDEAMALVAPLGNDWLLALIEYELGLVAHDRSEVGDAEDLLHAALARQVRHDLRPGIAATLDALGALALRGGEHNRGGALLRGRRHAAGDNRARDPAYR